MSTLCKYRNPCKPTQSNICDNILKTFEFDKWLGYISDPDAGKHVGHLFDGLTYLLQAAQEWQVQSGLMLNCTGYQVQIYSMDSAFLRARSLFEFFIGTGQNYGHADCLFKLNSQLPKLFVALW